MQRFFFGGPLLPPSKFPPCFTVLNVTFIIRTNPATEYRTKNDVWSLNGNIMKCHGKRNALTQK